MTKTLRTDSALCRIVFKETIGDLELTASLTRFGGLAVFVSAPDASLLWQGENILDARLWIDARQAAEDRAAAEMEAAYWRSLPAAERCFPRVP